MLERVTVFTLGFIIFCECGVVKCKKLGNENKRVATLHWYDRCVLISIPVSLVATCLVILLVACRTGGIFLRILGEWRRKGGEREVRVAR